MERSIELLKPHRVARDARRAIPGQRRAQADRTAQMRQRIVAAATHCLVARGFAHTSTEDIVRQAGVSRGALGHHFPTKADAIATAVWQNDKVQFERTAERLATAIAERRPLDEKLRIGWEGADATFAVSSDFWRAADADPELRAAYRRAQDADPNTQANVLPIYWARSREDPSPLLTRYVVGCFLNGLCYAAQFNDRETLEATFAKFVTMLTAALDSMGGVADPPPLP